ncbi:helix-turn-helix transcriptional regulator [Halomonas sp. MCCC 1A11036]|uniref:Helix-turn-helix transcriptional regulator n=1 Tax=Billgrantia zhangzhouensis TaxID=2733481 RepID=A0ABS9AIP6_9GAMM|nr:helix-turn-helix transcriptional regulator [Halomonas zhangzhouensis]MCE8021520.1 helix-turn-helix transcriptional regulator [Halomonas zhangzhouensis]
MRNIALSSVDATPREVLAIGTDYPHGTLLDTHTHRRAQFLYGMTGLMEVSTNDGTWVVPPYSGVWIPAEKPHRVRMLGVSTRSLYIEPQAAPRLVQHCEVLVVGPLLHQLLLASAEVPAGYDETGRDGALIRLILHELRDAATLPLFAPLPCDPGLARLCTMFLQQPSIQASSAEWSQRLNKSPRSFSRFFKQQTGLSFSAWRQQACLLAALPKLTAGVSITAVALELGYDSPSAFSTMFRKALGQPPSIFVASSRTPIPSQAVNAASNQNVMPKVAKTLRGAPGKVGTNEPPES